MAIVGLVGNIVSEPAISAASGDSALLGGAFCTEPGSVDQLGAH
jgi:hypothetical protein